MRLLCLMTLLLLLPATGLADGTHRGSGTLTLGKTRLAVRSAVAYSSLDTHYVRILLLSKEVGPGDFGEGRPILDRLGEPRAELCFWFESGKPTDLRNLKYSRLDLPGGTLHWNSPGPAQAAFTDFQVTPRRVRLSFRPLAPEARSGDRDSGVDGSIQVDTPLYPQ